MGFFYRFLTNYFWMLIGLSMLEHGCGYLAHHFSHNFFHFMILLSLVEKLIPMVTISGMLLSLKNILQEIFESPFNFFFRKYLPVLKNYPINYIHEPWKAPEQVQKAAKCIVGVDYPKPMIDHEFFAKQNQERMRQVYQTLSTYRNLKTPATPEIDDDCISNVQNSTTVIIF